MEFGEPFPRVATFPENPKRAIQRKKWLNQFRAYADPLRTFREECLLVEEKTYITDRRRHHVAPPLGGGENGPPCEPPKERHKTLGLSPAGFLELVSGPQGAVEQAKLKTGNAQDYSHWQKPERYRASGGTGCSMPIVVYDG